MPDPLISGVPDRGAGGSILRRAPAKVDALLAWKPVTVSSAYTVTGERRTIFCYAAAGVFTVTLPTAVGQELPIILKKTDLTGNDVTVVPVEGQTIDLAATAVMSNSLDGMILVSDGSNWWKVKV